MMLTDLVPESADPDTLYAAFSEWADSQGLTLYPHQDEALIEIVSGANVILSTPTGSGKSLVATAGHFAGLAAGDRSFYSAQPQSPGVWIFDLGLMKSGAFASALCGARFGSSNPKQQAARLGNLIASRL